MVILTFLLSLSAIVEYNEKVPDTLPSDIDVGKIKKALAFKRQLLMYLDALQDQMIRSRSSLIQLSNKFDASISQLRANCRAKTAVSVDQVYVSSFPSNFLQSLISLFFPPCGPIGLMNCFCSHFAVESSLS